MSFAITALSGSLLASCGKGDIASACQSYKKQMESHAQSNPVLSGNFDTAELEAWNQKNKELAKGLMSATGIPYRDGDSLESAQENISGIMQASVKCKEAGVDMMTK